MARKVNPIPRGYRSVTPVLIVQNAAAAIDWYKANLSATENSRLYGADGFTIVKAELKIGNSLVLVSDEMPAYGILSPFSLGGAAASFQIYAENIKDLFAMAVGSGAAELLALQDTYWGERTGRIADPFGHIWTLSEKIENVSAKELARRGATLHEPVTETVPRVENEELTALVDIPQALAQSALTEQVIPANGILTTNSEHYH